MQRGFPSRCDDLYLEPRGILSIHAMNLIEFAS